MGPKEPRDDDDDDSDDDAAVCECARCNPLPIPEGEHLIAMIKGFIESMCVNYDGAGEYGSKVSNSFAAVPMPPAVEAISLQYAVDCWNAADRATIGLIDELKKIDARVANEPTPELNEKTLESAQETLARMRAGRPFKKNKCDHISADGLESALFTLLGGDVKLVEIEVKL